MTLPRCGDGRAARSAPNRSGPAPPAATVSAMHSRRVGAGPGTEAAPQSLPSQPGRALHSWRPSGSSSLGARLWSARPVHAAPGRAFTFGPRRPLSVGGPTQGDAESSGWLLRPPIGHYGHDVDHRLRCAGEIRRAPCRRRLPGVPLRRPGHRSGHDGSRRHVLTGTRGLVEFAVSLGVAVLVEVFRDVDLCVGEPLDGVGECEVGADAASVPGPLALRALALLAAHDAAAMSSTVAWPNATRVRSVSGSYCASTAMT